MAIVCITEARISHNPALPCNSQLPAKVVLDKHHSMTLCQGEQESINPA
jgi:hypothetical protein